MGARLLLMALVVGGLSACIWERDRGGYEGQHGAYREDWRGHDARDNDRHDGDRHDGDRRYNDER